MRTVELIDQLSSEGGTRLAPRMTATLLVCIAVAAAYSVAAIVFLAGVRPDLEVAGAWVAVKAGLAVAFACAAAPLVLRAAKPGVRLGVWLWAIATLFALAFVATCATTAQVSANERVTALTGNGFPHLLVVVPVLAIPAAALLMAWMRRQAPTRPAVAGGAAGILAGGLAAAAYALTCPVDVAPFVAAAYTVAIAICGMAGAVAGRFALRW